MGEVILPKHTIVNALFVEILKVTIVKKVYKSSKNSDITECCKGHSYKQSREATGKMGMNSSRKDSLTTKGKFSEMNISSHSLSVGIASTILY